MEEVLFASLVVFFAAGVAAAKSQFQAKREKSQQKLLTGKMKNNHRWMMMLAQITLKLLLYSYHSNSMSMEF